MIKGLEDKYQDYVNGPYMVEVDRCDSCTQTKIVFVLKDILEYRFGTGDKDVVRRRIRFCINCMRSVIQ